MPRLLAGLAFVSVLLAAACSSSAHHLASGDSDGERCALRPQDSTFMAAGPVYRDCSVKSKAVLLTTSIHPDFQPNTQGTRSGGCYSADLEYVVDAKGMVETKTARVVRTNNQALAEAFISILPQWKFQPARLNDEPVRQIVIDRQVVKTIVVAAPAGTRPVVPAGSPHATPGC